MGICQYARAGTMHSCTVLHRHTVKLRWTRLINGTLFFRFLWGLIGRWDHCCSLGRYVMWMWLMIVGTLNQGRSCCWKGPGSKMKRRAKSFGTELRVYSTYYVWCTKIGVARASLASASGTGIQTKVLHPWHMSDAGCNMDQTFLTIL
jgi:hypothetical protein